MIVSLKPFILFPKSYRDIISNVTTVNSRDVKNVRSSFRIISIDDEVFMHKEDLKQLGFNIGYFSSIEDVPSGDKGAIFICDILGELR